MKYDLIAEAYVDSILAKECGLTEMAIPSDEIKNMTFWHGTKTTKQAEDIMKNGIKVSTNKSKDIFTPVLGANYATNVRRYATTYAFGGSDKLGKPVSQRDLDNYGEHAYLFKFSGHKLTDVQPDEDSIGGMLDTETGPDWLHQLAKTRLYKPYYSKVVKQKNMLYWPAAGKSLVKAMSDEQKLDLIQNHGAHIANFGIIHPDEVYRIHRKHLQDIKPDASNIEDFMERIK